MQKSIKKIVSMLLTIVLFMLILFGVPTHAISTLCVEDHFEKLKFEDDCLDNDRTRTPPSVNSCPYTALSMLLSFYDSYWRDDFIVSVDGINETDWEQGIYYPATDTLMETFNASEEAWKWEEYKKRTDLITVNL